VRLGHVERKEAGLQIVEPLTHHPAAEPFRPALQNYLRHEGEDGDDPQRGPDVADDAVAAIPGDAYHPALPLAFFADYSQCSGDGNPTLARPIPIHLLQRMNAAPGLQ